LEFETRPLGVARYLDYPFLLAYLHNVWGNHGRPA
jgi:hypothetical protein